MEGKGESRRHNVHRRKIPRGTCSQGIQGRNRLWAHTRRMGGDVEGERTDKKVTGTGTVVYGSGLETEANPCAAMDNTDMAAWHPGM